MNFTASFWVNSAFVILVAVSAKQIWKKIVFALDCYRSNIQQNLNQQQNDYLSAQRQLDHMKQQVQKVSHQIEEIQMHAQEETLRLKKQAYKDLQNYIAYEEKLFEQRLSNMQEQMIANILQQNASKIVQQAQNNLINCKTHDIQTNLLQETLGHIKKTVH